MIDQYPFETTAKTEIEKRLCGKSFEIKWCETCGGIYVKCPICGNNSCSGGSGRENQKSCKYCELTYA